MNKNTTKITLEQRDSMDNPPVLPQQQSYYNRPEKKAWWETLLEVRMQTAGTAAGAAGGAMF